MRSVWRPGPVISAWLELLPVAQAQALQHALQVLRRAAPLLEPEVKWGNLVLQLRGVPVLALAPARRSLQLQLFHGGALARQFPQLEGTGPGPRVLRWRLGQASDDTLLAALAQAALAQAEGRLARGAAPAPASLSPPPP
jgi:hypothetical protein